MWVASLGSGSKGNATLISSGETRILLDCGFPTREAINRLQHLSLEPTDIDAILVTHEHSDHISGVVGFAKAARAPVYATHGTGCQGRLKEISDWIVIDSESHFKIGKLSVTAVPVPHDAREPTQFCFSSDGLHLGVLTDLGYITPIVQQTFKGCQTLILEFNHDVDLLRKGPYPTALKKRVGGDYGHLNNLQALEFLEHLNSDQLKLLVAAHISQKNNSPECVNSILDKWTLRHQCEVLLADQSNGFGWLEVSK